MTSWTKKGANWRECVYKWQNLIRLSWLGIPYLRMFKEIQGCYGKTSAGCWCWRNPVQTKSKVTGTKPLVWLIVLVKLFICYIYINCTDLMCHFLRDTVSGQNGGSVSKSETNCEILNIVIIKCQKMRNIRWFMDLFFESTRSVHHVYCSSQGQT